MAANPTCPKAKMGAARLTFFKWHKSYDLLFGASMLVWRRVEREYWVFSWCMGCLGVQGFSISVVEFKFRTSKFSILGGL